MALRYVGSRHGASRNLTEPIVLDDSITVAVGDAVKVYVAGFATNAAAAVPLKGIVHAIVDSHGLPPVKGANVAGTAISPDTSTVTTAADNTTTGLYSVIIDTSVHSLYSAEVSGTIGTTGTSNLVGCKVDIDSANTDYGRVLESTATRTIGTPANFYSHGVDEADSTRLIVSIAMPEEMSVME